MIAALLLAAQAATPATPAAPQPLAGTPPQRIFLTNCPESTRDEIVVCGDNGNQRLPLPDERERPNLPRQPSGDARAGLDNAGTGACASSQWGCVSSVNIGAIGMVVAREAGKLFRKRPDTANRIAIDLDAPPPSTAGKLLP